jgi:hypothetical protein
MSFVGDVIGDVVGGITGAKQAGDAAEAASRTQAAAAQAGIDEQRRQFDKLVELMAPYVTAGTGAMTGQQALIGLQGPQEQQQAIAALQQSPEMQALIQQGENAMLQNAAATGGLRGGNVQSALAQFRPQILSQMIGQQYQRLGGLSTLGQASAAGQAASGMQSASQIGNLLAQQGAARAGGQIAQGAAPGQAFGQLLQIGSAIAGAGGFGGFGGGQGLKF